MKLADLRRADWSSLRRLQEIKLISSMYVWIFVVPIAAKLLSHVEEFAAVTLFDYTFVVPLSLPFSWKVFYFSAICFAAANVVHRLRCPNLVRDYPTFATFREEGKPDWHLSEYADEIGIDFDEFKDELEVNMVTYDGVIPSGEKYSQSVFWHLYWRAREYRPLSFQVTRCLYAFGLVLIGYVVLENLIWVVRYLLR